MYGPSNTNTPQIFPIALPKSHLYAPIQHGLEAGQWAMKEQRVPSQR